MELLDRYLHAVKFWLPRQQQDDIIAEISEDLRSQIEDREAELGRKLDDNEVAALLRKRGRPLLVANGYLPQHSLIGPVLFPIYTLVLKIAALCFVIPRILVLIGFFIFDPKYRHGRFGCADRANVVRAVVRRLRHLRDCDAGLRGTRKNTGKFRLAGEMGSAEAPQGQGHAKNSTCFLGV